MMQPLSEALHHRLPASAHRVGGRYFGSPALSTAPPVGSRMENRHGEMEGGGISGPQQPIPHPQPVLMPPPPPTPSPWTRRLLQQHLSCSWSGFSLPIEAQTWVLLKPSREQHLQSNTWGCDRATSLWSLQHSRAPSRAPNPAAARAGTAQQAQCCTATPDGRSGAVTGRGHHRCQLIPYTTGSCYLIFPAEVRVKINVDANLQTHSVFLLRSEGEQLRARGTRPS